MVTIKTQATKIKNSADYKQVTKCNQVVVFSLNEEIQLKSQRVLIVFSWFGFEI